MYTLYIYIYTNIHTTTYYVEGDEGTQYASVIFVHDTIQLELATRIKEELQGYLDVESNTLPYENKIVETAIVTATTFYNAEVCIC